MTNQPDSPDSKDIQISNILHTEKPEFQEIVDKFKSILEKLRAIDLQIEKNGYSGYIDWKHFNTFKDIDFLSKLANVDTVDKFFDANTGFSDRNTIFASRGDSFGKQIGLDIHCKFDPETKRIYFRLKRYSSADMGSSKYLFPSMIKEIRVWSDGSLEVLRGEGYAVEDPAPPTTEEQAQIVLLLDSAGEAVNEIFYKILR